jgi:peptidyl-prolyl cis-trans isomerase SurA
MIAAAGVLGLAAAFGGEIVDRIVVTVNRGIVTESDVRRHIRAAAALNGEPPDGSERARREAIERMIDLALIRREMELSRFPEPTAEEARAWAALVYGDRLKEINATAGLTQKDLTQELRNQLITLRFIEFRFRPGVAVTEAEIKAYYTSKFLPEWKPGDGDPPPLDDVHDRIERILTAQRIDEALGRWLEEARKQARIVFAAGARPDEKIP